MRTRQPPASLSLDVGRNQIRVNLGIPLAYRELARLALIWQAVAALVVAEFADREFFLIALRVWVAYWVVTVTVVRFRGTPGVFKRATLCLGPVVVVVILAAWCL